ncbi:hypothetical protein QFZ48_001764 [Chitinophaga sp. W2I13]|uniref:hypothetical protein n=1 Tax=Chitinophaga sp. W2I13 TaxID=3373923 RepID=UPI003D1FA4DD
MIHATRPGLVLGFHGCEEDVRDALVRGSIKMSPSSKPYDWLGSGCYFWENSYERAYDYACNPPGNKVIRSPAVLRAVIDLKFCLDLLDATCLNLVRESYHALFKAVVNDKRTLPVNMPARGSQDLLLRNLDCAVIENLHIDRQMKNLIPYDSVRIVFMEGNELYPNAGFKDKNHIQICVRNPNCIRGYFNPVKDIHWQDRVPLRNTGAEWFDEI